LRVNPWQELRRRKVFRTAGLYIVGAWLVIQVADISFPAWGLPETAIRYLFVAAAGCFPFALVFGWFFDVTAEGIVRTRPADESEAVDLGLKRFDYVILAAIVAIGAAVLLGSLSKIREELETSPAVPGAIEKLANSVGVLPFTNLDSNPNTGFFSDGITEEILHRLSTLGALHVLASTSSFAFRNSDESPASISDKLGVRYLLQGSVRRDGDRVLVTARLLDEKGFQLWSDRFDRKLEGVFAIQAEIAGQVAGHVRNELVSPLNVPDGRMTENMEAYNAYLRGRALFEARTAGWKEQAGAAFDKAIEIDPEFAPPYAGKATLVVNTGVGPHWEEARDFALKALELDPELPFGHATLGLTLMALGDNERGVESLQRAITLDPSLAVAYTWITLPLRRLGRHDEARAMQQRGLEIDPLNPVLIRNAAEDESSRGNVQRAEHLLLRLASLPEPPVWTFSALWTLYSDWGRYAAALDAAKESARLAVRVGVTPEFQVVAFAYAALGLVEDAEYWFALFRDRQDRVDPPLPDSYFLAMRGVSLRELEADANRAAALVADEKADDPAFLLSYGGLAWTQLGKPAKGIDWLERGLALYQHELVPEAPPDGIDLALLDESWGSAFVLHLAQRLAFAYSVTGDDQGASLATRFLAQSASLVRMPTNPQILEDLATTQILLGDTDAALDSLRQGLDLGWSDYYRIINHPVWAGTLDAPEFQGVLAEVRANNDRQRAIVEAADAEHDFRAELEQLSVEYASQR
jgi:TolB-like protein/Tfp pilus assembly protein PilF